MSLEKRVHLDGTRMCLLLLQYGTVYGSALWCVSMHECRQEKGHA